MVDVNAALTQLCYIGAGIFGILLAIGLLGDRFLPRPKQTQEARDQRHE